MENVLIVSCAELLKTAFKIIPRFDRCRKGSMTIHLIENGIQCNSDLMNVQEVEMIHDHIVACDYTAKAT